MSTDSNHAAVAKIQDELRTSICSEIARLSGLSKHNIRAEWAAKFQRESPKGLSKDLLLRTLAWRLQADAFGEHDRAVLKMLDAYARHRGADPIFRRLKPGTTLIREYQGVRHTVTISQESFVWQRKAYPSLSMIARAITGCNWNGPRFFGLRTYSEKGERSSKGHEPN